MTDKASGKTGEQAARPADLGRAPGAAPSASELNAMLSNPATAFVAATAIGFGIATQMANLFLSSLQAAGQGAEATKGAEPVAAAAPAEKAREATAPAEEPVVTKKPAKVVTKAAEPVVPEVKPVAQKPRKAVPKAASQSAPDVVAVPQPVVKAAIKPAGKAAAAKLKASAAKPVAAAVVVEAPAALAAVDVAAPVAAEEVVVVPPAVVEAVAGKASKGAKTGRTSAKGGKDDLKRISGLGPKLEQMLHARGVTSYAAMAGWSAEDIARIDGELELDGRILRDDWVGQAKTLMKGSRKR